MNYAPTFVAQFSNIFIGDAGPSALDWLLMGDDGSEKDSVKQLMKLNMESEKKR